MINWEKLKENSTLENMYNILCRNEPTKNTKKHETWDYLESIAYEELLDENENPKQCEQIIDEIIDYLKQQKKEVIKCHY